MPRIRTEIITNKLVTDFCDSSNYPIGWPLTLSMDTGTGSPKDVHLRKGRLKVTTTSKVPIRSQLCCNTVCLG